MHRLRLSYEQSKGIYDREPMIYVAPVLLLRTNGEAWLRIESDRQFSIPLCAGDFHGHLERVRSAASALLARLCEILFNREFIPDHRHGDPLARLLAERAVKDKALKSRLFELANGDLSHTKRMLLAKVFGNFSGEDDRVEGLYVLRDDGSGLPPRFSNMS